MILIIYLWIDVDGKKINNWCWYELGEFVMKMVGVDRKLKFIINFFFVKRYIVLMIVDYRL